MRLAALAVLALLSLPASAAAQSDVCLGDTSAQGVPQKAGPPVRFGMTPAGEAGVIGPPVPLVPEQPEKTLAALAQLRPAKTPYVLRLNRFFWSEGEAAFKRFLELTDRYTSHGYLVELQVRYHPTAQQEGDIDAWTRHVREVVRRFGANPRVVALQVTNEANFIPFSPDSSDSAFRGVRDALIQGVEAAKDEAGRLGYSQLRIGFNWVYRNDPESEASFWGYLHDHGGTSFARAVDWVGLDAYPGTVFPPVEPPGGHRDGMVAAISQLRKCFMPIAGLGESVPIHVEENGWPTSPPARSYDQQSDVLDAMVRAVSDFRGTYNVSDYRWFDLRDHNSSSPNFQAQYGLLRDDYAPKPAFERYRRDVSELALRWPGAARLGLRLRYRVGTRRDSRGGLRRRCAASKPLAKLRGADLGSVVRADFSLNRQLPAVRGAAPFTKRIAVRRVRHGRAFTVSVTAVLDDDRVVTLVRRLRRC